MSDECRMYPCRSLPHSCYTEVQGRPWLLEHRFLFPGMGGVRFCRGAATSRLPFWRPLEVRKVTAEHGETLEGHSSRQ